MIAAVVYILLPAAAYHHSDSRYLRARYVQNLVAGDGFVYNPGEHILLTSSPLLVLAQAASGEINHPAILAPLLIIGLGIAAMLRALHQEQVPMGYAAAAGALWIGALWHTFGGVEWWLACLSLIAIDLAANKKGLWAGLVTGLMMLVSPAALIFVVLLGLLSQDRRYWIIAWLPA